MVSFRQFVFASAVFFWDGQALNCAYENESTKFCDQVIFAYDANTMAELNLDGDKFKDDRIRVSVANRKVLDVLNKKNESELRDALRRALHSETHALFNVRVSCKGQERWSSACQLGASFLCFATEGLVNAIIEIAEGAQKRKISNAYKNYLTLMHTAPRRCAKYCVIYIHCSKMVSFQLFVVVLASFFWDGRALECAYQQQSEEFCRCVKEAYQLNNSSEHLLKGATFKDDRERIARTIQQIREVLKEKYESGLIPALCRAMDWETITLFSARGSCSGSQKESESCKVGLTPLCLAVEELVNAAKPITKGEQQRKILNASSEYQQKENKTDRLTWAEQAYEYGKNVMTILNCWDSHNI